MRLHVRDSSLTTGEGEGGGAAGIAPATADAMEMDDGFDSFDEEQLSSSEDEQSDAEGSEVLHARACHTNTHASNLRIHVHHTSLIAPVGTCRPVGSSARA